jgi:hypothetical protein
MISSALEKGSIFAGMDLSWEVQQTPQRPENRVFSPIKMAIPAQVADFA